MRIAEQIRRKAFLPLYLAKDFSLSLGYEDLKMYITQPQYFINSTNNSSHSNISYQHFSAIIFQTLGISRS